MMPGAHRDTDSRYCGASTIVTGQGTVYVNGLLWAVQGDQCSHGSGDLVSVVGETVKIGGKTVIVLGDTAGADDVPHFPPDDDPSGYSSTVNAY